jgi:hypothetical protein
MAKRPTSELDTNGSEFAETSQRRAGAIGGAVSDAIQTVRDVAGDAASRLPDVTATTGSAFEDANRQLRASSDEMLMAGTLLSFGFAMGLLVGGASRILVAGSLVPAVMMGLTMLDRSTESREAR